MPSSNIKFNTEITIYQNGSNRFHTFAAPFYGELNMLYTSSAAPALFGKINSIFLFDRAASQQNPYLHLVPRRTRLIEHCDKWSLETYNTHKKRLQYGDHQSKTITTT